MIKRITGLAVLALAAAGAISAQPAKAADAATKCHMTFNTSGWAAIYKRLDGQGHVMCDNGQSANVMIHIRGGGLTAGKYSIEDGKGEFTNVKNINEIFGDYATAGANAGAVKSAESLAMTKGEVSLAVTGVGRGFNLGVDVSKFEISRK
jgi:major membrane immunogen (membrane-anchored lipoprotein)